jgi:hypothetical protein
LFFANITLIELINQCLHLLTASLPGFIHSRKFLAKIKAFDQAYNMYFPLCLHLNDKPIAIWDLIEVIEQYGTFILCDKWIKEILLKNT